MRSAREEELDIRLAAGQNRESCFKVELESCVCVRRSSSNRAGALQHSQHVAKLRLSKPAAEQTMASQVKEVDRFSCGRKMLKKLPLAGLPQRILDVQAQSWSLHSFTRWKRIEGLCRMCLCTCYIYIYTYIYIDRYLCIYVCQGMQK